MSASTRRSFYAPAELTAEVVHDVMSLVAADLPPLAGVERWTETELLVAYDWAIREHLRASDNPVHWRPRPHFTRGP